MSNKTKIEWTDFSWNPVTGCDKVSTGCKHCYAETMAHRLQKMGSKNYADGFKLTLQYHMLRLPLSWRKPRRVFVNSMSDLFHKDIPDYYIDTIFGVMAACPRHTFQVLTKRPERALAWFQRETDLLLSCLDQARFINSGRVFDIPPWPLPNVWLGVSVENDNYLGRIDLLRKCSARIKFLSCEPLLGPLRDMDLTGIDWVIVGGESGPFARKMRDVWVLDIKEQCEAANIPFFFKQWGGGNKKKAGRMLEGKIWDAYPGDVIASATPPPVLPPPLPKDTCPSCGSAIFVSTDKLHCMICRYPIHYNAACCSTGKRWNKTILICKKCESAAQGLGYTTTPTFTKEKGTQ